MKKVSVIVGAYNAHDTLARCLTSLVHQTLEDIEIIVVNDASKDDTWEIMQRCKAQFPDKVVILNNEQNMGCGGAKNSGLEVASGEYIGFCDSDDYCALNMFELLYNKAKEKDADIVDCGFYVEAANASTISTPDEAEGILDDDKRKKLIFHIFIKPLKISSHLRFICAKPCNLIINASIYSIGVPNKLRRFDYFFGRFIGRKIMTKIVCSLHDPIDTLIVLINIYDFSIRTRRITVMIQNLLNRPYIFCM